MESATSKVWLTPLTKSSRAEKLVTNIQKENMSWDNYPPGAANDPRAPYNEVELPEVEFDCNVTQTLTIRTSVSTNNYIPEDDYDDVCGCRTTSYDTSDVNWDEEFASRGIGIPDLLEELKKRLDSEIENIPEEDRKGRKCWKYLRLKELSEACGGWKLEEQYAEED